MPDYMSATVLRLVCISFNHVMSQKYVISMYIQCMNYVVGNKSKSKSIDVQQLTESFTFNLGFQVLKKWWFTLLESKKL